MEPGKQTDAETENKEAVSNWPLIRRMLGLVWIYRAGCIKVLILNLLLLALGMYGLGLMGVGVDFIRYHLLADTIPHNSLPATVVKPPQWPLGLKPPDTWTPMAVLSVLAGAILLFAGIRARVNFLTAVETNKLVQGKIVVDLRARVYDKMQRLSFSFFDTNPSGSLINRVTGDVQSVRMFVDDVVLQVITLLLSLAMYIAYMIRINPSLTAACLASTPLLWTLTARFSRTVGPAYNENRSLFDRLILMLSENLQGVHVVKGFARQPEEIAKFEKMNNRVRDQQFWIFKKISTYQPVIHFMTHVNIIIMLIYGGYLVMRYEEAPDAAAAAAVGLSIGQLLVFAGLLQQFSGQVANFTNIANSIQQSLIGAQRVFEVLDAPLKITSPFDPVRCGRCRGEVSFDNVTFSYLKQEPVLSNVSFTVRPGECAAILGQTGSGKTTLLSLVSRFYDPDSGRVMIDGIDVRNMDVDELRRNIGIVFQESFLFSNTVAANIAFGHPEADRERTEKAAKIACAHDFIMEMPKGYDTILHESGANLSGGQRQRIAIARALLLEPPILLMDDPMAAIDPETEKEIMKAMENAMEGRTTFIVAHRLSTLRRADKVIVLKKGRIIQHGTHEELMQIKGQYSMAAQLQIPDKESLRILGENYGDTDD